MQCKECGRELPDKAERGRIREWCSDKCRMRAARRRSRLERNGATTDGGPTVEPGRVRCGLEAWLEDQDHLPCVTVAAARVLADELDADTGSSPLWGRYAQVLAALTAPEVEARSWNLEVQAIYEEFATIEVVEEWRAQKCREAVERGEDPERWSRLVPVGCVRGHHAWHRYGPHAPRKCLDCDTREGEERELID